VESWALISPDGVAPSQMVRVSACVNLPLHHEVQRFSSGASSPGWSQKRGCKTVVCVCVCVCVCFQDFCKFRSGAFLANVNLLSRSLYAVACRSVICL